MKVLLAVDGLANKQNPAGSSYNNRFALALKEKGIEVIVLHLRAISPKRLPIRRSKMEGDIEVIECSSFILYHLKKSPLFVPFIFAIQIRIIKRLIKNIDVVHAVGGGALEPSFMISNFMKIPLLSQFIGSDINVQASYFQKKPLFNKALSMSSCLCFNSFQLLTDFERYFDLEKPKEILYRGINLDEFEYSFNKHQDTLVILFLGGFPKGNNNLKGGLTLLEAINLIDKSSLKRKIEIRIGGPNSLSQEFKKYLNTELQNNNLKVSFIGSIERKQVMSELHNSNIVLIPSISEGVPNVLFEAMAAGNAIVATKVGGIPEFLNDKNGILINANNPDYLAESIIKLQNDLSLICDLAVSARRKIELHSYENFISGYIRLYNKCLNS